MTYVHRLHYNSYRSLFYGRENEVLRPNLSKYLLVSIALSFVGLFHLILTFYEEDHGAKLRHRTKLLVSL